MMIKLSAPMTLEKRLYAWVALVLVTQLISGIAMLFYFPEIQDTLIRLDDMMERNVAQNELSAAADASHDDTDGEIRRRIQSIMHRADTMLRMFIILLTAGYLLCLTVSVILVSTFTKKLNLTLQRLVEVSKRFKEAETDALATDIAALDAVTADLEKILLKGDWTADPK